MWKLSLDFSSTSPRCGWVVLKDQSPVCHKRPSFSVFSTFNTKIIGGRTQSERRRNQPNKGEIKKPRTWATCYYNKTSSSIWPGEQKLRNILAGSDVWWECLALDQCSNSSNTRAQLWFLPFIHFSTCWSCSMSLRDLPNVGWAVFCPLCFRFTITIYSQSMSL